MQNQLSFHFEELGSQEIEITAEFYNQIRHSPCFFCKNLQASKEGWYCYGDKFASGKFERKQGSPWPIMLLCSEADFHSLPRAKVDVEYFTVSQAAIFLDRLPV